MIMRVWRRLWYCGCGGEILWSCVQSALDFGSGDKRTADKRGGESGDKKE